jgi:muramoyltetrapeptide carboxypeptidase
LISSTKPALLKPPALRPGDTIGIVAPASNIKREDLDAGCSRLQKAGYRPIYLDSILSQDLYFAGSVERRARELEAMFARDDIRAIVCARGGYGSNYLLPALNFDAIKAHPKIFVGYSDLTSLLTCFSRDRGFVTFHGPMAAKDWVHQDGVDMTSWQSLLNGAAQTLHLQADSGISGLCDGEAEGILYGGCLSILVASLGTPYEMNAAGAILFLEDVAAKPFQIDRMLMQLKLAGKLDDVRGIVFGEMRDCIQAANQGYTLQEIITRIMRPLRVPVALGLRSGHVAARNITLPIGVRARLAVQTTDATLTLLEPAVTT